MELELQPDKMIPPLLSEVRRICDLAAPPKSREGCVDCDRMGELVSLLHPA
jgi:hypothetical protein